MYVHPGAELLKVFANCTSRAGPFDAASCGTTVFGEPVTYFRRRSAWFFRLVWRPTEGPRAGSEEVFQSHALFIAPSAWARCVQESTSFLSWLRTLNRREEGSNFSMILSPQSRWYVRRYLYLKRKVLQICTAEADATPSCK